MSSRSDRREVYCLNGRIVEAGECGVSLDDFGLLYGEGLFETMRVEGGKIAHLDRHLARLKRSADFLKLPLPSHEDLRRGLRGLLDQLGPELHRCRLTVTRGSAGAFDHPQSIQPTWFLRAAPLVPPSQTITAVMAPFRRDETHPLNAHKTTSYLQNLLARRFARDRGAGEAIFLNHREELAEGSTSNLFIMKGKALLTPPVSAGVLPGVMRSVLLERAHEAGLSSAEASLAMPDLLDADAAFLTNAVMGIVKLTSVDGRPIGKEGQSAFTSTLRELVWWEADYFSP